MAATRRAAWREGAADGWHEDLIWYAAAIHQMRLLTPRLDEFEVAFEAASNGSDAATSPGGGRPRVRRRCSIPAQCASPMRATEDRSATSHHGRLETSRSPMT